MPKAKPHGDHIHPLEMKYELTASDIDELADKWLETKRARQFRSMRFCCFLYAVHQRAEKLKALKTIGDAVK